ncbi:MAG TPA: hypothetical protein VLK65_28970 [Vicinamibacteria bacterium]|nr:hypothetical protein [Vicinamibacteria bacterium]
MPRNAVLSWLVDPEPPGLGLDLRAGEMALVRLSEKRRREEIDVCLDAPLPPGLIAFSMQAPNILDAEGLAKALNNVFLRAGVSGSKRVALTLPDYVSRITILELPNPPSSSAEIVAMLKFRLKKSIPFEVDQARVAYERLPGGGTPRFLTGFMRSDVVSQYEDLLGGLGLHVGLVLPSTLSLLRLLGPVARRDLSPDADYFFANFEHDYFSLSLIRADSLSLVRTLGLRADSEPTHYAEDDMLREIIPTAIYYREKLEGQRLERVYYRSLRPEVTRLREILEEQFEVPTEPFHLLKAVKVGSELSVDAGLADSVAAAAGGALGRVA